SKDIVINKRWRVIGKIGQGSFGEVFEARDIYTGKAYAIKRESKTMRHPQLLNEYTYYNILQGGPGVPNCYWHGEYEDFNCLVLDLLGPSLKELRQCIKGFPLDIIVDLGCQMASNQVDILHHVHDKGLVFRDMKPDNFLFSSSCHLPEMQMLYIVDFGLTTYWRDPETGQPFPEGKRKTRNKIGTARYASLNVHHGRMHTRRDDLEGLAYMILDMILGSLPWSGIQARNSKVGWDRMRGMKKDIFMSDLCAGRPIGIVEFAEYTKQLRFAEEPDYELLKRYLRGSLPGGEFSKL
ncbi:kinase-like domain-containing protein, partial [Dichotomocladium elegans]